jgi:crossover junction endodeoxyribonuclease RuvC
MPSIVAIDPGVSPTICVLIEDRGKYLAADFYDGDETSFVTVIGGKNRRRPSAPLIAAVLRDSLADLVVIEDVHALPADGVAGAFAFGFATGLSEGVATALGKRVLRVTPQLWKKAMGIPDKSSKAMSRHVAISKAPHLSDSFKLVKSHDRADAFLMAYWARGKL